MSCRLGGRHNAVAPPGNVDRQGRLLPGATRKVVAELIAGQAIVDSVTEGAHPSEETVHDERVQLPRIADVVAARLRRQIISGALKEGDTLPPEGVLSARYGISKPTMREALRVLEAEALLSVRRGARGGPTVHTPSLRVASRYAGFVLRHDQATLLDVYEALAVIEPQAARLAIERASADNLAALDALQHQAEASVDDLEATVHLHVEFHRALLQMTGNKTLAFITAMLHDIIESDPHIDLQPVPGSSPERKLTTKSTVVHRQFIELARAGAAVKAERLWTRHLGEAVLLIARREESRLRLDDDTFTTPHLQQTKSTRTPSGPEDGTSEDPVRLPRMAEVVAARIRRQIVLGELTEGDSLPPEHILTAQFGVSKQSVREALRVLEAESLLSIQMGLRGGPRVHSPSADVAARYAGFVLEHDGTTLADVHEALAVIEPPIIGRLAKARTAKGLAELNRLQTEADARRPGHPNPPVSLVAFHRKLIALWGNKTLTLVTGMLHNIIQTHPALERLDDDNHHGEAASAVAHREIISLLKTGSERRSRQAWQAHLEAAVLQLRATNADLTALDLLHRLE